MRVGRNRAAGGAGGLPGPAVALVVGASMLVGGGVTVSAQEPVSVTWCGQACFVLESGGFRVVIDPIPATMGYPPLQVSADLVLVSHEHFDHNNVAAVSGNPQVVRGLTAGGGGWASVDLRAGPVHVRGVPTYHDGAQGAQRGRNTVFVLEWGGIRFVHAGDLGHRLDEATVQAIGRVDVLFVPVGGFFTIDAAGATGVVEQLRPSVVIPMHYRTPATGDRLPIAPVDGFLAGKPAVRRFGSTVQVAAGQLPASREIWVLAPPS